MDLLNLWMKIKTLLPEEIYHFLFSASAGLLVFLLILIMFYVVSLLLTGRVSLAGKLKYFTLGLALFSAFFSAWAAHVWLDRFIVWYTTPISAPLMLPTEISNAPSSENTIITNSARALQATPVGVNPAWGHQTKNINCKINGYFPDLECTPGAIVSGITKDQVCDPKYSTSISDITDDVKIKVFAEYNIRINELDKYKIDRLIPSELGGSNDISNLWPQLILSDYGPNEKEQTASYLYKDVCANSLNLTSAEIRITRDWIAIYQGYKGQ